MRWVSGLRHLHSIIPLSPTEVGIIREVINPCSAVLETIYSKADKQYPARWARVGMEMAPGAVCIVGPQPEKGICCWEGNSLFGQVQTDANCLL